MCMVSTAEQRGFFEENGYLLLPAQFSRQEIAAVMAGFDQLETERRMAEVGGRSKAGMIPEDAFTPRLQFDVHRTETRFALLCRHPRVAGLMQELLGVPLYLYHSKLAFKAPFTGSVQYWHQDYGYWRDSHPRPDMGSVLVMLDEHTEDNACLQVLAGSHRGGVADHEVEMRQSTGDGQRRIPAAAMPETMRRCPRIKVTGSPGTVLAWHCNTIHGSSHNLSENPRRALITAFNAMGNHLTPTATENPFAAREESAMELCEDDALLTG
jgi:ectoine hydroxylase-related dioxygenase (phytanoyl-CoA dioxygenase family)